MRKPITMSVVAKPQYSTFMVYKSECSMPVIDKPLKFSEPVVFKPKIGDTFGCLDLGWYTCGC